jgi:HlyD family secretion protein
MAPDVDRNSHLQGELASLRIDRSGSPTVARRRRMRVLPILLLLVALVGGAVFWEVHTRPVQVTVATAVTGTASDFGPLPVLSGSGYVVTGDRYVSIGVRVPGRIDRYFVEEGQAVQKGQALVQLDDREYRATVARARASLKVAQANLKLAEADLRRGTTLREQGVISQQELDVFRNKAEVARATVTQLTAELEQSEVNLEYTVLRAPSDGVVLAKLKEVGEIAVPGGFAGSGDLVRIANLDDMRAEVDVNEADLNRVHIGQAAEVTPDAYPDARYPATVVKLYPQVDRQKGTLRVEVHITQPDARLLPDMSARVTFLSDAAAHGPEEQRFVLVPSGALRRDQRGDTFVWVVNGDRAHRTIVETAGNVGERVRVVRGLSGGETVIVGETTVRDGQRVRVVPGA